MFPFLERAIREAQWEPWYAWRPVKVHGKWRWFDTVYRRKILFKAEGVDTNPAYDYGDLFDILADTQHN